MRHFLVRAAGILYIYFLLADLGFRNQYYTKGWPSYSHLRLGYRVRLTLSFFMPYFRVYERAIRILSRRTRKGISTIQKSRRKRLITVPWIWEDKSSFRNVHQQKKRVPKEQNGPGSKDFLYPIMQLVVTASGQVSSRLG